MNENTQEYYAKKLAFFAKETTRINPESLMNFLNGYLTYVLLTEDKV